MDIEYIVTAAPVTIEAGRILGSVGAGGIATALTVGMIAGIREPKGGGAPAAGGAAPKKGKIRKKLTSDQAQWTGVAAGTLYMAAGSLWTVGDQVSDAFSGLFTSGGFGDAGTGAVSLLLAAIMYFREMTPGRARSLASLPQESGHPLAASGASPRRSSSPAPGQSGSCDGHENDGPAGGAAHSPPAAGPPRSRRGAGRPHRARRDRPAQRIRPPPRQGVGAHCTALPLVGAHRLRGGWWLRHRPHRSCRRCRIGRALPGARHRDPVVHGRVDGRPSPDRTSPEADTTQADSSNPEDDEDLLDAAIVTALIRKVAGGTQGAHLEDLLATGKFGSRSKANLKALLIEEYHLPVESFGTRVDGRKRTRDGVRLRHLPPAAADPAPSTPA